MPDFTLCTTADSASASRGEPQLLSSRMSTSVRSWVRGFQHQSDVRQVRPQLLSSRMSTSVRSWVRGFQHQSDARQVRHVVSVKASLETGGTAALAFKDVNISPFSGSRISTSVRRSTSTAAALEFKDVNISPFLGSRTSTSARCSASTARRLGESVFGNRNHLQGSPSFGTGRSAGGTLRRPPCLLVPTAPTETGLCSCERVRCARLFSGEPGTGQPSSARSWQGDPVASIGVQLRKIYRVKLGRELGRGVLRPCCGPTLPRSLFLAAGRPCRPEPLREPAQARGSGTTRTLSN